jgi:ATP-dependent helicase HepA
VIKSTTLPIFAKGQCWVSESEPELGVGKVISAAMKNVEILFESVGEKRIYRKETAPLQRFVLKVGDTVVSQKGKTFVICDVQQKNDLFYYLSADQVLPETFIAALQSPQSNGVMEDLLKGRAGQLDVYKLRQEALHTRARMEQVACKGLIGPRVQTLAHQFYVAEKACAMIRLPRLLLADEVGLGKTIEAGLIYHRLRFEKRIERTLILTPDSLKYQWMVEFYRKFNQMFTVVDAEMLESLQAGNHPFKDNHNVLISQDFVQTDVVWELLKKTSWDLLIVDEAHRVSPHEDNGLFNMVSQLALKTPGVLFLTATPATLDEYAHFRRLGLLDVDFYHDFEEWKGHQQGYFQLATKLRTCIQAESLGKADFAQLLERDHVLNDFVDAKMRKELSEKNIIRLICEHFGPGKSMIRNSRKAIGGFPKRKLQSYPLELPLSGKDEWDVKLQWLGELLTNIRGAKILCIVSEMEVVRQIQQRFPFVSKATFALFHEEIPLVARDRAAAWFSEPNGAQILFCSEMGSEGRNFQFAHHLVLLDLPLQAGLLEQRIGRLDRIGQLNDIMIHVPFIRSSRQDLLYRFYHWGLNLFCSPVLALEPVYDEFGLHLQNCLQELDFNGFEQDLLPKVQAFIEQYRNNQEEQRDFLLEFNSSNPQWAQAIIAEVQECDEDLQVEKFVQKVLRYVGADVDPGPFQGSWVVHPGDHMILDSFPGLGEDGMSFTSDRMVALEREDLDFFSWEHPITQGALDVLLSQDWGKSSFVYWEDSPEKGIFVYLTYVLEHAGKHGVASYLPEGVFHFLFDTKHKMRSDLMPTFRQARLVEGPPAVLNSFQQSIGSMLGFFQEGTPAFLESLLANHIKNASQALAKKSQEVCLYLERINRHGSREYMDVKSETEKVLKIIEGANLRLDSIQIVFGK